MAHSIPSWLKKLWRMTRSVYRVVPGSQPFYFLHARKFLMLSAVICFRSDLRSYMFGEQFQDGFVLLMRRRFSKRLDVPEEAIDGLS